MQLFFPIPISLPVIAWFYIVTLHMGIFITPKAPWQSRELQLFLLLVCMLITNMALSSLKSFLFPATRQWKLASLMDEGAEMQKCLQNNPKKTAIWMPPTTYPAGALAASVCHPPSPSASVQWELPEGPSVRANNRKYTKVGIQTSTLLLFHCILFCPIVSPLSNSCIFIILDK